jgi:hypothetical protein
MLVAPSALSLSSTLNTASAICLCQPEIRAAVLPRKAASEPVPKRWHQNEKPSQSNRSSFPVSVVPPKKLVPHITTIRRDSQLAIIQCYRRGAPCGDPPHVLLHPTRLGPYTVLPYVVDPHCSAPAHGLSPLSRTASVCSTQSSGVHTLRIISTIHPCSWRWGSPSAQRHRTRYMIVRPSRSLVKVENSSDCSAYTMMTAFASLPAAPITSGVSTQPVVGTTQCTHSLRSACANDPSGGRLINLWVEAKRPPFLAAQCKEIVLSPRRPTRKPSQRR